MSLQELKKHKQERQVAKQSKLASMDPVELQEQVHSLRISLERVCVLMRLRL